VSVREARRTIFIGEEREVSFVWTNEAVERLMALHAQGLSGSEVASRLGDGLTRGAVFGKLHRLGLTGSGSGSTKYQCARPEQRSAACGVAARGDANRGTGPLKFNFARKSLQGQRAPAVGSTDLSLPRAEALLPPPSLKIALIDLNPGQCRFIAGEDGLACGHPTLPGSSWCPAHHRIVFAEEAA